MVEAARLGLLTGRFGALRCGSSYACRWQVGQRPSKNV